MNGPVLLLCLLSYLLLASLPFIFFRRGRFNAAWLMTAAPFFVNAALIIAALAHVLSPVSLPYGIDEILAYPAVALVTAALVLTGWTIGAHHVPVSLWHQQDDTPAALVTIGPYAGIRHPFYVSFMMMLAGTAAALPYPGTLVLLALGTVQLQRTARREERRLLASPLGAEYAAYMERTGRFLPRMTGIAQAGGSDARSAGRLTRE